jgi:hypothetical protein
MNLELSDTEAEALARELHGTINYARYPLSPRIQTLRAILNKLEQPQRLVVQIIRLVPGSEGCSRPEADASQSSSRA